MALPHAERQGGRDPPAPRGLRNRDEGRHDPLPREQARCCSPQRARITAAPSPHREMPCGGRLTLPTCLTQAARVGAKCPCQRAWPKWCGGWDHDGARQRVTLGDPWAAAPGSEEAVDLKERGDSGWPAATGPWGSVLSDRHRAQVHRSGMGKDLAEAPAASTCSCPNASEPGDRRHRPRRSPMATLKPGRAEPGPPLVRKQPGAVAACFVCPGPAGPPALSRASPVWAAVDLVDTAGPVRSPRCAPIHETRVKRCELADVATDGIDPAVSAGRCHCGLDPRPGSWGHRGWRLRVARTCRRQAGRIGTGRH